MRLSDLDPAAVGLAAAERVLYRLSRLAVPLSPGVTLDLGRHPAPGSTGLALTVADLCRYAQTGATGDWGDDADAEGALLEAGEALWSRAIDDDGGWTPADLRAALAADDDPTDPVRLAVGAGLARWLVWCGTAVTTGELAALASLSPVGVRQAAARGQLTTTVEQVGDVRRAMVAAPEARRWLAARGVAGWR